MKHHSMSEEELQAIEKQAASIIDSFYVAIKDHDTALDIGVSRKKNIREPKTNCDPSFKEKLLKNAPNKNPDYILAEKKSW